VPVSAIPPVSALPACISQVYAPSIDEMVSSFPENRQLFLQYVNTRPHTIKNFVNTTDIDNIIDRVRSAYWYHEVNKKQALNIQSLFVNKNNSN